MADSLKQINLNFLRLLQQYKPEEAGSGVLYSQYSSALPTTRLAKLLSESNTALPAHSVTPNGLPPRYLDRDLTASGYTITDGPLKGQVIVAGSEPSMDQVNTQAHEAYHQRVLENGGMPKIGGYAPDALANYRFRGSLSELMNKFQPRDKYGPYFGLNHSSSAQEQIANLAGYEGMQPKGTSMMETPIGKEMTQDQIDYYFTQSSVPFGGVWQGQSKYKKSITDEVMETLKRQLLRAGINTVNR